MEVSSLLSVEKLFGNFGGPGPVRTPDNAYSRSDGLLTVTKTVKNCRLPNSFKFLVVEIVQGPGTPVQEAWDKMGKLSPYF